jgi:hypothetical protein
VQAAHLAGSRTAKGQLAADAQRQVLMLMPLHAMVMVMVCWCLGTTTGMMAWNAELAMLASGSMVKM